MNDRMRLIQKIYVFVIAATLIAVISSPALALPAQNENDEAAIRALVDKINQAWLSEKPSALFQEIMSDKGCVVALPKGGNPSEAVILNKQKFCELIDSTMQSPQRPQKHEHKVESITIIGPLAYEIGEVLDITADGSQQHSKILNFFAKDETGWKLIHSTPADNIRKALRSIPGEEERVCKVAREFLEIFQLDSNDPFARMEEIIHDGVAVVTSDGRFIQGRENVLRTYRQSWEEVRRKFIALNTHYDIQSVNVADDAALVFGKVKLDGRLKDANDVFHRDVWETLILQKINGKWGILREYSTKAADPSTNIPEAEKVSPEQTRIQEENVKHSPKK